ncbi:PAS domain S-box protein [Chloroflexota bacterium]
MGNHTFANGYTRDSQSVGTENIYATLIELAPDGIIVVKEGVIQLVNPKFARMVGHSTGKLINHYLTKVVSPDSLYRIEQRYRNIVLGEKVPSRFAVELLTRDGRTVSVEANATFIEFDNGVADLVFLREISENK